MNSRPQVCIGPDSPVLGRRCLMSSRVPSASFLHSTIQTTSGPLMMRLVIASRWLVVHGSLLLWRWFVWRWFGPVPVTELQDPPDGRFFSIGPMELLGGPEGQKEIDGRTPSDPQPFFSWFTNRCLVKTYQFQCPRLLNNTLVGIRWRSSSYLECIALH